jgi:hypothetical protein
MFTRRIDVYSYRIHTTNHSGIQFFFQFTLIHIVLVLAYANGFGSILPTQPRITQSATDRNGSTNRNIIIREFLTSNFDAEYTEAPASETMKPEPLYQKQFFW